jgi:hypothetical protein
VSEAQYRYDVAALRKLVFYTRRLCDAERDNSILVICYLSGGKRDYAFHCTATLHCAAALAGLVRPSTTSPI